MPSWLFAFTTSMLLFLIFSNTLPADVMQEAFSAYQSGEHARTVYSRQQGFNRALSLYSQLEQSHDSNCNCGALEYNLGNTFFQLEQYPWAILHYNRALFEMPGNQNALYNLSKAKEKLNLPNPTSYFSLKRILLTQDYIPLSTRFTLFFFFGAASTILLSLGIWATFYFQRVLASITSVIALYFFLGLGYSHYFAPIEAVIIEATNLYRDPLPGALNLTTVPLSGGLKVEVLGLMQEGQWMKIISPDGKLGFVSYDKIRLI